MGIVGSMNIPLVIKYRKRAQVDELSEWVDGVGYAADFKTIIFNTKVIKIHYIWYYYFILSNINV